MSRPVLERVANGALSVLAAVGVLCVVVTLLGLLFGVRPLVFTSGSMGPSIDAGALALAHSVDAADLGVGDVVSVTADGDRVTHRIAAIEHDGDRATLTLRGDGNTVDDAHPYTVDSADRVFLHVPWLGRAVAAHSGSTGVFLGGMLAAALLWLIFRPRRRGPGDLGATGSAPPADSPGLADRRHTGQLTLVAALLVLPLLATTARTVPTLAYWTDEATATSGSFAAHRVVSQATPTCTNRGGVAGLLGYAELAWDHVDARYEYAWTATRVSDGTTLASGVVSPAGPAGSEQTLAVRTSLLNLSLAGQTVDVALRARLKDSPSWTAQTVTVTRVETYQILVLGLSVRCG